jgi:hypothetical protein
VFGAALLAFAAFGLWKMQQSKQTQAKAWEPAPQPVQPTSASQQPSYAVSGGLVSVQKPVASMSSPKLPRPLVPPTPPPLPPGMLGSAYPGMPPNVAVPSNLSAPPQGMSSPPPGWPSATPFGATPFGIMPPPAPGVPQAGAPPSGFFF